MKAIPTPPPPQIGILVKMYPKLSETFVHHEIEGLRRLGMNLAIYALKRPADTVNQFAAIATDVPITYVPEMPNLLATLALHLRALATRPLRYLGAAHLAWRRPEEHAWSDLTAALWLSQACLRDGTTHLHAHFASVPAGIAELCAILAPITFSISAHAKDIYASAPAVLQRKMQAARFTVTCTEYNRRHLLALSPAGSSVYRVLHGVDCEHLRPPATEQTSHDRLPVILSVGRLREKKGFDVLIDACRLLRERGYEFHCDIVGYGDARDALAARIADAGLNDTATLLGARPHPYVVQRYRSATVFVLPCRIGTDGDRDGIPNVLVEAMACGVPVVSTPVSGIPEAIGDEVTGLLVAPDDATALANAIARLLEDRYLRQRLARAARAHVERHFSASRNIRFLHRLLLNATAPEREGTIVTGDDEAIGAADPPPSRVPRAHPH